MRSIRNFFTTNQTPQEPTQEQIHAMYADDEESEELPPQIQRANSATLNKKDNYLIPKIRRANSASFNKNTRKKKQQPFILELKINNTLQDLNKGYFINRNRSDMWKHIPGVKNICNNISNNQSLVRNINMYGIKESERKERNEIKIFPYCNEDIVGMGVVDYVNASSISTDTIGILSSELNLNISQHDESHNTSSNKNTLIKYGHNSPLLFYSTLRDEVNKNYIIVSHGSYMGKLYDNLLKDFRDKKIINGRPNKFQNLDVIHLIFNNQELVAFYFRLFDINYSWTPEIESKINGKIGNKRHIRHVFIMRHCVGCHNITSGAKNKIKQASKQATLGNQMGYLSHAMCIKETVHEITEKKSDLINLFNNFGGLESYSFGSSIIFRAILTSGLLYNILYDNVIDSRQSSSMGSRSQSRGRSNSTRRRRRRRMSRNRGRSNATRRMGRSRGRMNNSKSKSIGSESSWIDVSNPGSKDSNN